MSFSPTKRRRSNTSSAIAVDASDTAPTGTPNTGKRPSLNRASFQSPTKASLARSHPEVLSRVLSRSAAQKARRSASHGPTQEPADANGESIPGLPDGNPARQGTAVSAGRASKSQGAPAGFRSPERVGGHRPSADQLPHRPQAARESEGHNLRALQAATGDAVEKNAVSREDTVGEHLEHDDVRARSRSSDEGHGEPELPPTPTELGLEKLATRSKGPLSSSPSLQHEMRKRKRRKATEGINSSPLKLKGARPGGKIVNDDSQPRNSKPTNAQVSDKVREKQRLRDELSAQLERLRTELSELEYEARRSEWPHGYPPSDDYLSRLMELLVSTNPSCAPPPPKPAHPPSISSVLSFLLPFSSRRFIPRIEPEPPPSAPQPNPFTLEQPSNPAPYITLFAPLSIAAHTTIVSSPPTRDSAKGPSFVQKHNLTLFAPPEYPPSTYQVSVEVYTDPEKHCVTSISIDESTRSELTESNSSSIPEPLKDWMDCRLSNPRLKLDISGLCWGVCRYWEAAVSRAKVWVELESLLSRMRRGTRSPPRSKSLRVGGEAEPSPRALRPHFARTHFLFSLPEESHQPQLLVTCALSLDVWTSEPQLQPVVCVNRPPISGHKGNQAEREARKVLWSVLKNHGEVDTDGLIQAVEAVVSVVFETK